MNPGTGKARKTELMLKRKTTVPGNNGQAGPAAYYLTDKRNGLYVEEYFRAMLCLERGRTERSDRPFILMLITPEDIPGWGGKEEVVKKITDALFFVTRQTDIKGWYKYGSVIGVIFTHPAEADGGALKEKTEGCLRSALRPGEAEKVTINTYVFPEKSGGQAPSGPTDLNLNLYPDLIERDPARRVSLFIKRAMDIAGGIVGLIAFSPLFLGISILIKLSSRGPVLFRQERVGIFGRVFTFLKFRSMRVCNDDSIHREYIKTFISRRGREGGDSGAGGEGVYKIKDDPRVTGIGRLLRKSSLDEFPQFLNVLKGEMSLVGPRPPVPYEFERYEIWHRRRLLEMKPGITGLWQVKGRSSTTFDEMVRLDLKYIGEWSLMGDIRILLRTPWVVLTSRGAY